MVEILLTAFGIIETVKNSVGSKSLLSMIVTGVVTVSPAAVSADIVTTMMLNER